MFIKIRVLNKNFLCFKRTLIGKILREMSKTIEIGNEIDLIADLQFHFFVN